MISTHIAMPVDQLDHDFIDKDIGYQWSVIMISIDIAPPETRLIMIWFKSKIAFLSYHDLIASQL